MRFRVKIESLNTSWQVKSSNLLKTTSIILLQVRIPSTGILKVENNPVDYTLCCFIQFLVNRGQL